MIDLLNNWNVASPMPIWEKIGIIKKYDRE